MKQVFAVTLALVALCAGLNAQNRTRFGGQYVALDYAYGILPGGAGGLQVSTGNAVTGSSTVTLVTSGIVLGDGRTVYPLATNAPITIDAGANAETVTPSSLSNCSANLGLYTCQVTATFTYRHGTGTLVTSGTVGLQESINAAFATGGGQILIDGIWTQYGGTTAMVTAAIPYSSVSIKDNRTNALAPWWSMQPSTLTVIAAPAVQTTSTTAAGGTNFTATPVGTWGTSAYYFCITYVDALGGESGCSASYTQTPGTTSYTLNTISPIASTGAVGWRQYAGITSTPLAYLLPITSSNCTLTTLETVMPACAIGSNGQWSAIYVSTTSQSPVAQAVTAVNNPVPQSHTTFAYQPAGSMPQVFQTNYGPFSTTTVASATAAANTILGSFNLPTGFMNYIGRTVRVTGKLLFTAGASSTESIQLGVGWAGGLTAGLPITVCNAVSGFVYATQPYTSTNFSCTMTTNAVGATAIGTIQPESWFMSGYAAGTLIPVGTETSNTAITTLGLFSQNTFSVILRPSVAAATTVQLLSLHVEVIQ